MCVAVASTTLLAHKPSLRVLPRQSHIWANTAPTQTDHRQNMLGGPALTPISTDKNNKLCLCVCVRVCLGRHLSASWQYIISCPVFPCVCKKGETIAHKQAKQLGPYFLINTIYSRVFSRALARRRFSIVLGWVAVVHRLSRSDKHTHDIHIIVFRREFPTALSSAPARVQSSRPDVVLAYRTAGPR